MRLREGASLALRQIRTEKLKSAFSVLAVVLGVMFLIVVVTIVEGLDSYVREDFTRQVFGVNTVTLRRWDEININTSRAERRARERRPRLLFADADAVRRGLTLPARVAIENRATVSAVGDNGRTVSGVRLAGASPEIFEVRNLSLADGRAFTPQEAAAGTPVVVIGSGTADALFEDSAPVGRTIRFEGFPYRVVGVLTERGSLFGQSLDNLAIAPARSPVQAITAPRGVVENIIVQAVDPNQLRDLQLEVEAIMRVRRRLRPTEEADFSLETADEAIGFWDSISRMLFTALPVLVSIALVVGGIVIMNIMLVSVIERTREIGIRKAVGARRQDILTQVLIESATLSTVGAMLGIVAGLAVARVVSSVSPIPAAVAPGWILLAVALGMTVGIAAGVYPASRGARLDPVDALSHE